MSIVLVHMPYAAVERPSIGLGILQACLRRGGLDCHVFYANLLLAQRLGLARYQLVEFTPTDIFLGEWTFGKAAFPDFQPDAKAYFAQAELDIAEAIFGSREQLAPIFTQIREDMPAFIEDCAQRILAREPKIVGCSSTFQQHCASLALLRRLKELRPTLITMMGGANCEGPMGQVTHRQFEWVDYVVSGEADEVMVDLMRGVLEGRQEFADSILTPQRRGQAPGRTSVQKMDDVPTPDYDDYFAQLDQLAIGQRIEPGLLLESSRGCWWGALHHCTFCGLNGNGMAFRSKSPEKTLEDFSTLQQRYSSKRFEVVDNILDMRYFASVLPRLEGQGLNIFYETKANLRRDHVQQLARSGVRWIQPGIESMHDEVLSHIQKGSTALTNVQLLKWTREFGVRVSWNFLSGFPGEKDEWYAEMAEWLPLIAHLQPPQEQSPNPRWTWRVTQIRYERFSPYHVRPDDYQLNLSANRYYSSVYPLDQEGLDSLAYFFEDQEQLRYPRTGPRPDEDSRPGRLALERWVDHWIRIFWKESPIVLSMIDVNQQLKLVDTRPCAPQRFVCLEGRLRELYLACETPQTCASLGVEADELAGLVENKLLLLLGGRYLALAVRGDCPPLPRNRDFPGGCMNVDPSWVTRSSSQQTSGQAAGRS